MSRGYRTVAFLLLYPCGSSFSDVVRIGAEKEEEDGARRAPGRPELLWRRIGGRGTTQWLKVSPRTDRQTERREVGRSDRTRFIGARSSPSLRSSDGDSRATVSGMAAAAAPTTHPGQGDHNNYQANFFKLLEMHSKLFRHPA